MTSTPVSLNDESLNGSWIDINSASQIHSPMEDGSSSEFLMPPYPQTSDSVQSFGLISFQVERFLQEVQRNQQQQTTGNATNNANNTASNDLNNPTGGDDNSGIYISDSETASDGEFDRKALITSLKMHQRRQQQQAESNNNDPHSKKYLSSAIGHSRLSKSGELFVDQLSDSLSLLSRASGLGEQANFKDFDWLWDWTDQPEYFAGQEWKVYAPKQDYLMRQRQLYNSHGEGFFSGEVMSLLFLTNILSILIGAGLTYSIMMRRSSS